MTLADDAVHHLDRLGAVILDDVGDGPRPADLAAAATAARDAVAKLAVPALTQLTSLVAGVADALAGGTAEWNPSLGGTLMAAVDDLRHLASRAPQFSEEDSEHLHHRATELAAYGGSGSGSGSGRGNGNGNGDGSGSGSGDSHERASDMTPASPLAATAPAAETAPIPIPIPIPTPTPTPSSGVVPIDTLFYSDAGPHIVRGGISEAAASRSDLLGRGIDALDVLVAKPIARPVTFGAMEVVPVETLLYRGRAALERAAALREQIKASGGVASPAALDEMYDLIGLALKD